jgi:hypothetical protein
MRTLIAVVAAIAAITLAPVANADHNTDTRFAVFLIGHGATGDITQSYASNLAHSICMNLRVSPEYTDTVWSRQLVSERLVTGTTNSSGGGSPAENNGVFIIIEAWGLYCQDAPENGFDGGAFKILEEQGW